MPRVIVADDSSLILKNYSFILEYLGVDFVLCHNGREALENFIREPADLVVLDVSMPIMDGLEACRQIRRLPQGIGVPVIIVSSMDDEEDILNGLDAGANDYLLKPIKEAHFIAKLRTFLKTSSLHKVDINMAKAQTIFAKNFQIERLLGYGAHSVVFLASDIRKSEQKVAIKLLREDIQSDQLIQDFFKTAEKLKSISSPYILKIFDFGQFNDRLYLIIEYADEGDLARIIKPRKLPEPEAVKLGLNMANALVDLESKHLIHMDIKPENIMCQNGVYKLGDFGFNTTKETATMPIDTQTWTTPAYLAPEFLSSTEVCHKSDVYSLGVTLYQVVTGDNPFLADKPVISMFRQVNLIPPSLKECNNKFTNYFSDTVNAMIAKDPEARPSAKKLVEIFTQLNGLWELTPEPQIDIAGQKPINTTRELEIPAEQSEKKIKNSLNKIVPKSPKRDLKSFSISQHRFDRHSRSSAVVLTTLKLLLILCVIASASFIGGSGLYRLIFSASAAAPPIGALTRVVCEKCAVQTTRRITDISECHCEKCGSPMRFLEECASCHYHFPLPPPPKDKENNLQEYVAWETQSKKCPKCDSTDTHPAKIPSK